MELSPVEFDDLRDMVCRSIAARYDGRIEFNRLREGYLPSDASHVHDLIEALWDNHIAVEIRQEAFRHLTTFGAKHWPHGHPACPCCGDALTDKAEIGRNECFACYVARQD